METIKKTVQEIIEARNPQVDEIISRLKKVKEMRKVIEDFKDFKNGKHSHYTTTLNSINSKFELNINAIDISKLEKTVEDLEMELNVLHERYSRPYINIATIGRTQQGKSTLWNSLTGLGENIIPVGGGAAAHNSCTGTRIKYVNNAEQKAEVHFWTKKDFLNNIKEYVKELGLGNVDEITLDNFTKLQKPASAEKWDTTQDEMAERFFKEYVEHYIDYKDDLGDSEKKPHEINIENVKQYVAQVDKETGEPLHKYIAVKEVVVYTPLKYEDSEDLGKIQLVDTRGIGETSALGIDREIQKALVFDSDIALLIKKYRKDGHARDIEENRLFDLIDSSVGERKVKDWMFFLCNKVGEPDKGSIESSIKSFMGSKKCHFERDKFKIVDCSEPKQVYNELVSILTEVLPKIKDIDKGFEARANELTKTLEREFEAFLAELLPERNFCEEEIKRKKIESTIDKITAGLKTIVEEKNTEKDTVYLKLKTSIDPYLKIDNTIDSIVKKYDNDIENAIKSKHHMDGYTKTMDKLRFDIIDKIMQSQTDINELVLDLKKRIVAVFKNEGEMKPLLPSKDTKECLDSMIEKTVGLNELKKQFENIAKFDIFINNFLLYEIRKSITKMEPNVTTPEFNNSTKDIIAAAIINNYKSAIQSLNTNLQARVYQYPNNCIYGMIAEFRDRVTFSEPVKANLKKFYLDNYDKIFKEDDISKKIIAVKEWNDYVDKAKAVK